MGIEIQKSFVVAAPVEAVWDFLTDPRRVADCLPGAAVTNQLDERSYEGTMTVRVGPVTGRYKGKVRFERLDAEERTAEIVATGQDVRGKGGAEMRMTSRLVSRGSGETEVSVVSDVNVMGILAQFGRGMIQDVSDQLFQQFTEAMRGELEGGAGAAAAPPDGGDRAGAAAAGGGALDVGAVSGRALGRAAGRAVRRPGFWIGVILLALIIAWLWR